jgi:hypothetical protein
MFLIFPSLDKYFPTTFRQLLSPASRERSSLNNDWPGEARGPNRRHTVPFRSIRASRVTLIFFFDIEFNFFYIYPIF